MATSQRDRALWVQCVCTALVAVGAAYASYRHAASSRCGSVRRGHGGDLAIDCGRNLDHGHGLVVEDHRRRPPCRWPVDGLVVLRVRDLLSPGANVAAAPELSVLAVAVAACLPLALLLAVELLNRALKRHRAGTSAETATETSTDTVETGETGDETGRWCVSRWSRTSLARRPSSGCGPTTRPSGPRAAHRPARSWTGRGHKQLRPQGPAQVAAGE